MTTNRWRKWVPVFWMTGCSFTAYCQESVTSNLGKLIFIYEVEREELKKPITILQAKYAEAVDRLTLESQAAGQLEQVLALKREREGFADAQFAVEGTFPQLLNLRAVYQRELKKLLPHVSTEEERLKGELLKAMENLKAEFTKVGQLEEAIEMADAMNRIETSRTLEEEILNGTAHFRLSNPADQMEVSACKIESKEGLFHVSMMDGQRIGRLKTKDRFSPPFVVTWEVATDGGNIRFYYAELIVILNHESGRNTLQVRDPSLGHKSERMIPEMGRVTPDEFHEVKLIVDYDRYAFMVDDIIRAEGEGDYKGLIDSVTIGPAFGSELKLRRFEIHR